MSMATLEREILSELKEVTDNKKLTKNSIMEWRCGSKEDLGKLDLQDGEKSIYLPKLNICVAFKG